MSHNGSKCGGVFHLETHLTGENPIRNLDSYLANHIEVPAVAIRPISVASMHRKVPLIFVRRRMSPMRVGAPMR